MAVPIGTNQISIRNKIYCRIITVLLVELTQNCKFRIWTETWIESELQISDLNWNMNWIRIANFRFELKHELDPNFKIRTLL